MAFLEMGNSSNSWEPIHGKHALRGSGSGEAIIQKKKEKAPIKSYSVSDVGLKKRKVVLRSSNNKLGKLPQIDHRLMLNRKKKMV